MTDSHRLLRRFAPLVVAVLALSATGCSAINNIFQDDPITLYATFDDVGSLVPQAHVRAGDVPIGLVTDINLTDDFQARVTMEIRAGTGLPSETKAVLSKTGLLGERFVDLRPIGNRGRLQDNQVLDDTEVVTDFEELVESGTEVLAFVAADQLATSVQIGARAFGGRGGLIGQFLEDVQAFVGDYEEGKQDLTRLIDSVDELTRKLAANAEDNAQAIAALDEFAQALQEEDTRLLNTLEDVNRLSEVGSRILRENREKLDDFIRRTKIVLDSVTEVQGALQGILTWLPRHNRHVANGAEPVPGTEGVGYGYAQVWLDFQICGETDQQGDPSEDCTPPNPGTHAKPPPYHPNSAACMENPENCDIPESSEGSGIIGNPQAGGPR